MAFSGALTLTDLNDFITPSQACIKPVEQTNGPKHSERDAGAASTEIIIDSNGTYYEVSAGRESNTLSPVNTQTTKLPQAQISLNDCLACSGCITSAESVLITLQSHTEVLNFLEENKFSPKSKIPVVSIAPQSLASLAATLSSSTSQTRFTPCQILRRLQPFLTSTLGFAHVFDTTFARHLALKEHVAEFIERKNKEEKKRNGCGGEDENYLPMLASACPGWICYAEKAHSEMLPFIARTKSPQQVMGTLVKEWMGKSWGRAPDGIYHVTVMPCYDKKLEASRQDFYNDIYSTRDVDCVITTGELELMMRERGWDLTKVSDEKSGEILTPNDYFSEVHLPELIQHPGTSSGSYLHSIISHLRHESPVPLTLNVKMVRNSDYEEYTLVEEGEKEGEGKVVFKGAKCYGFRNLQNIVRKVGKERGVRTGSGAAGRLAGKVGVRRVNKKDGEEKEKIYDYVEVMACPGGCVNGGGQLRPRIAGGENSKDQEGYERNWEERGVMQHAKWGDRQWTRLVEEAYWRDARGSIRKVEIPPTPPDTPPPTVLAVPLGDDVDEFANRVLEELCAGDLERRRNMLRTSYRAVESDVIGLAVKW